MTTRPAHQQLPEPPKQPKPSGPASGPNAQDGPRSGSTRPPALIVLNYDVDDHDALHAYRALATGRIDAAPGILVTSTDQTLSLGEAPLTGTHTVILWYPSLAVATERYESADYQALVPQRLAATTPRAAFVLELVFGSRDGSGDARRQVR